MQRNDPQRGAFVGRHFELTRLDDVLSRACGVAGTAAIVSGEAGIGKTRLTEEVVRRGRDLGALVGWGRCYEQTGAPAFWPWMDALRALLTQVDEAVVDKLVAGLGPEMLAVLPSEAHRLTGSLSLPVIDPADGRFRLFESTTTLLTRLATISPVVVVIDDLHWADRASLALVEFLAGHLGATRLLLMVTVRVDHAPGDDPLARALGVLGRTNGALWTRLGGLSADDSRALLADILGHDADAPLALDLHRRTDGNPLFLAESARYMQTTEGGMAMAHHVLPPTVTELIGRRFAGLSSSEIELLTLGAIVGRGFSTQLLQVAGDVTLDTALDFLDSAERARLICGEPTTGTFEFTHPLIRDVLTADLPTTRRARLHRRVGEAIQSQHEADLYPVLGELAFHFSQAAATGSAAQALDYSTRAASRAAHLHSFEDAVDNYDLALTIVSDRVQRCELQLALGDVLNHAGDLDRAAATFADAATSARALLVDGTDPGAARRLGRAALGMTMITVAIDQSSSRLTLIDDALSALGDDEPQLRVELLTRLAGSLSYSAEVMRRDSVLDEALEVATSLGLPEALCTVTAVRSLVAWRPADLTARREQADVMSDLAVRAGSRHFMLESRRLRVAAMLDAGDIAALDAALADHAALAEEGFGVHRWRAAMWRTMRHLIDGQYADTEGSIAAAQELARSVGHPDTFFWFAAQLLQLRWDQDRLDELEASVASLVESSPAIPLWRCVLAALCADLGRIDDARQHVERVVADLAGVNDDGANPFAALLPCAEGLASTTLLADAAVAVADRARAEQIYDALAPYAGHGVMAGPAVVFLGCVDHRLAALAAVAGDTASARHHFATSVLRYERMRSRPWLARLYCDWASAIPTEEAGEHLAAASAIARELGMPGVLRRIAAVTATVGEASAGGHRSAFGARATTRDRERYAALTGREHEVIRLMASGCTNPQIARELLIAPKTVMHHAASVYRKLGVQGRTEAVAFVARLERDASVK